MTQLWNASDGLGFGGTGEGKSMEKIKNEERERERRKHSERNWSLTMLDFYCFQLSKQVLEIEPRTAVEKCIYYTKCLRWNSASPKGKIFLFQLNFFLAKFHTNRLLFDSLKLLFKPSCKGNESIFGLCTTASLFFPFAVYQLNASVLTAKDWR